MFSSYIHTVNIMESWKSDFVIESQLLSLYLYENRAHAAKGAIPLCQGLSFPQGKVDH